jgi:hypothetical protein
MDSATISYLACVRSGNPPAFCACLLAPDSEECERTMGACINAIGRIPNPKTGKLQRPNPVDVCKCGCSILFSEKKDDKKKQECNEQCDKRCKKK